MTAFASDTIRSQDWDALRARVNAAVPFPHFCIDGFLDPAFAEECRAAFPTYEHAAEMGREFAAVNERRKVQVTDSSRFPPPLKRLHEELRSSGWLQTLGHVMSIPHLLADPELVGGGIHETGPRGYLDVHVDFNYIEDRGLHRRLNILIYFNKDWHPQWGGNLELWDSEVSVCHQSFSPIFNRCVVFETTDVSYHGVTAVTCPPDQVRRSFAGYYYTRDAPPHWTGESHSTIFRARPQERFKGTVLMPLEKARWAARDAYYALKARIRRR